jgi:two-component sensor histidine kinase
MSASTTPGEAVLSLTPEFISVTKARRFVTATLQAWDLSAFVSNVALVVSELVTNSIIHAQSNVTVRLAHANGTVTLQVEDDGSALPNPRHHDVAAPTGRGLRLVGAMTSAYRVQRLDVGKRVHCEFTQVERDEEALLETYRNVGIDHIDTP